MKQALMMIMYVAAGLVLLQLAWVAIVGVVGGLYVGVVSVLDRVFPGKHKDEPEARYVN
jgi:hypothetical protein